MQTHTVSRIREIETYITNLIQVKKNINRTLVKFELYNAYDEKISLTFNDPFFQLEMKQKFMNDFIDKAIDYYQKEYQNLKTIEKWKKHLNLSQ